MKRGLALIVVVLAIVAVALTVDLSSGSEYRVAAIFDTAKGMVSGQQVKIAGTVVGAVQAVELAPGPKARIVMSIDRRFEPFRANASCTILSEGLISENYLQCTPGNASTPLATGQGGLPTVPLRHTTVPLNLQDILNVFSLPTDQRLAVLISELGIATAGRGEDLNGLLLRANPALRQSQRVLEIVDAQRTELAAAVGQTDEVLARLAAQTHGLRTFVDNAAALANTTARHATPLGESINRLPAMLAAIRPGLRSLDRAAANATPLLNDLHSSAPQLFSLTHTLPSFSNAAIPALRTLAAAAARGRPAVKAATPVISQLRSASVALAPLATALAPFLVSLRDTGGIEGTLRLIYALPNMSSLYDNVSHIAAAMVNVAPLCIAGQQAGIEVAGCNRKYSAPGQGTVPVNDPSCGPQAAEWMNATCPNPPVGPIALAAKAGTGSNRTTKVTDQLRGLVNKALMGKPVPDQQFRSLLDYLLK